MNVSTELRGKILLIDIEVVNSLLDYNLLLGCSYIYAMWVISSTIFQLLMLPHDGKIVTINQLTYYDPKGPVTPKHVLPTIKTTIDSVSIPSLPVVGQWLFTGAPLMDTFLSLPPPPSIADISDSCTIASGKLPTSSQTQSQTQP